MTIPEAENIRWLQKKIWLSWEYTGSRFGTMVQPSIFWRHGKLKVDSNDILITIDAQPLNF